MPQQPFLRPKLIGARFDGPAIPLEVARDFAALEEMVREVAKWRFLQENAGRQRCPRGFSEGISLRLTTIEAGSAVPQIELFSEDSTSLFPQNVCYFEAARDCILAAVDAADREQSPTAHVSASLLGYFDRIGRSLKDGETIELDPTNSERPARLTRSIRRRLLEASQVRELTEEVSLRGVVPEADQEKMTFELQVLAGPRVSAPYSAQHRETILEAFAGYSKGVRVLIQGIARYSRADRLQGIEAVEHISILEPNDVPARLAELRFLKDGWLDGKGVAPSPAGLDWLAASFRDHFPDELPLPFLYPTAEGGVQAEWSFKPVEISLEIVLATHLAQWHSLNLETQEEVYRELNLDAPSDWTWLSERVQRACERE